MGNSSFEVRSGHAPAKGVFSMACVENEGVRLAPQVGFEPTTLRLTGARFRVFGRRASWSPLAWLLALIIYFAKIRRCRWLRVICAAQGDWSPAAGGLSPKE